MIELQTSLFQNINETELEEMQKNACVRRSKFKKNEMIFQMGEIIDEAGLVLSGGVMIENIDLWGNKSILANIPIGQTFAETYAYCQEPLMVDALAAEDSEILFINVKALKNTKYDNASWKNKLIENMLTASIKKNLALSQRIFCTTSKTIRGRLLTYLSGQSMKKGSADFYIPFNRQQLADYLNLDRSALSKELGKMREEGLVEFHKNYFRLL